MRFFLSHRSPLRPALSPLPCFINQEIIKLLSTFDRSNKPTGSCAPTRPGFTGPTTILRWDFLSFQRASAPSSNPCAFNYVDCPIHPLQVLFNLGTMLT